jgi:hypothetical protein
MHRGWAYFHARLAFTMAAFNVLVQWHGLQPTRLPLRIGEILYASLGVPAAAGAVSRVARALPRC